MNRGSVTGQFQVGEKVWVPLAVGRAIGTIIEDRGPLGVSGQHLFRVSVPNDPYTPEEFLVQEDEISQLDDADQEQLQIQLSADAVMEYLIHGGLVSILQRNSPKPVWLRRGLQGNVTFTFIEGYSATGGKAAPRNALRGEKVFAAQNTKNEVIEFIKSFGLDSTQARHVVSAVGTAP